MNKIELTSVAEKNAEKAEELKAFSGMKLLHIKREISKILTNIGKNGIFDEYTKHDISHIDYMLDSLNWIIPENTQKLLTLSDWLMLTISIYFHDLGMLVTKDEFNNRDKTSFPAFKESILKDKYGSEFKNKIFKIKGKENQDRFIYQELVRKTHAERIKYWILNESNPSLKLELTITNEIKILLSSLDNMFIRDLAIICESHHLSDLDNLEKYKTNQQYGPSKNETVNLHYCSLILRTADLLHITSDRTPSIEFNLINSSDPKSQEEWAKQQAVKTIRPKTSKNKDGDSDPSIKTDTLEIIAFFENENGFFGLMSYLNYASKQLKLDFKHNEFANKKSGLNYEFPWQNIDDSSIETKDFEKRQFEFRIDQTKILDLLVGHTLYNDSSVVLRELTQNGLDASKLKKYELDEKGFNNYIPKIFISLNSNDRELSFTDNGTGMTLEIIQNHLLKVGSSRYQDENFIKKHPGFSSISRFGIGLLTCFLIADDIDIITKSSESEKAILLKIKKVHGKYLLKYLSINSLPDQIRENGTEIKLYVRSEVNLNNIENDLKKWILFPNCELIYLDNGIKKQIGYKTPKDFLEANLKILGYDVDNKLIKVKEVSRDGITIAYTLRFTEHLKEWSYLEAGNISKYGIEPNGTCIEGIRVDFKTPGFETKNLFAIVNSVGENAPKTNVARSNIEVTPEREVLLSTIYDLYLEHINEEIENLRKTGFSITWAANEGIWLLKSFTKTRANNSNDLHLMDLEIFKQSLSKMKFILIENNNTRSLKSINDLKKMKQFWSIDCASYSSADSLIKEVKSSNSSALSLLNLIFQNINPKTDHIENLLCNNDSERTIEKILSDNFQVDSIKIISDQRRLDLRWSLTSKKIWELITLPTEPSRYSSISRKCYIQLLDIESEKISNEIAICSSNAIFILINSALNKYLINLIHKLSAKTQEDIFIISKIVEMVINFFYYLNFDKNKIEEIVDNQINMNNSADFEKLIWDKIDKNDFIQIIRKTNFVKYDTTIWFRRSAF